MGFPDFLVHQDRISTILQSQAAWAIDVESSSSVTGVSGFAAPIPSAQVPSDDDDSLSYGDQAGDLGNHHIEETRLIYLYRNHGMGIVKLYIEGHYPFEEEIEPEQITSDTLDILDHIKALCNTNDRFDI